MGLAIEVGALAFLVREDPEGAQWFRDDMEKINEVLAEEGQSPHVEPEVLPEIRSRADLGSFPYSFIHHLRRFYARIMVEPGWTPAPVSRGEDPTDDPALEEETSMMTSHLLCHSDAEGYYIPVDFAEPIFDETEQGRIPGEVLGSSVRLMEELVVIAPSLGITLGGGTLSDEEARRINKVGSSEEGLYLENIVWITLFEAARLSIAHRTAINFC